MSEAKTVLDWLKGVAETLVLPALYLFFAGFIYGYYFFKHFGVSLQEVDIPIHFYLIYSFTVVYLHWPWILFMVLLIVTGVALGYFHNKYWTLGAVAVAVILFPVIWHFARETGTEHAISFRNGYGAKEVRVRFKDSAATCEPAPATEGGTSTCFPSNIKERDGLFLLTKTDDSFVVLYQKMPPPEILPELPVAQVFWIQKTDASLTEVRIENTRRIIE